jgi:hypothetical protein
VARPRFRKLFAFVRRSDAPRLVSIAEETEPAEATQPLVVRSENVGPRDFQRLAAAIAPEIGTDGTLTTAARAALNEFAMRFVSASPQERENLLFNRPDSVNPEKDRLLGGIAARLALGEDEDATRRVDCAWASSTGYEPVWPPPIASNTEVKTLVDNLDQRGFGFLAGVGEKPTHRLLVSSRIASFVLLLTAIAATATHLAVTSQFGGAIIVAFVLFSILEFVFPHPPATLKLLWHRLRKELPAMTSISVTFAAMLGVVAFVYISRDAWDTFGSLTGNQLALLAGMVDVIALLILWFRIHKAGTDYINRRYQPASFKWSADAEQPYPELRSPQAVTDLLRQLALRGLQPSTESLSSASDVWRAKARFDLVHGIQFGGGLILLAAIFAGFSLIVHPFTGAIYTVAGASDFPVVAAWKLSWAMVKVVVVVSSLAAVFFAVVTLSDGKAVKTFTEFECARIEAAHRVWAWYQAAK